MNSFHRKFTFLLLIGLLISFSSCRPAHQIKEASILSKIQIDSIAPNVWVHISYLNTNDFGRVACNGLIFKDQDEVVVIDSPVDDSSSYELIKWIEEHLQAKIIAVIPTHFHKDCLGGLNAFHENNTLSFANLSTIDSATIRKTAIPKVGFKSELEIRVGNENIKCSFLGAGHTYDNIVVYIPVQKVLFGGCLVKELDATKGNLEDADVTAWPHTIQMVKDAFPSAEIIVPGHGKSGDRTLLDYTESLFLK
ncbi:MAG TPA: subclass B1 metallo-beta-lactamase [Chitinophagales bacterium]|nr:subclass B1 metallo-beta-lactamase [Chitinophagales bacterium]